MGNDRRILYALAILGSLIGPAAAVENFPTMYGGFVPGAMRECWSSLGQAVPCEFVDNGLASTTVAKPGVPAQPGDRAATVTISPNSGASNPYPSNAIPTVATATGTTSAVTATMPAAAGRTTWLCGVTISALGGTATIGPVTITNLPGNTTWTIYIASSAGGTFFTQGFTPCIPAKAVNTAIAIATTADGTASNVAVNAWGYQQ